MMRSCTQFFVRIFPSPVQDWKNVKLDLNNKLINVRSIEDLRRGKFASDIYWQFKTDGLLINLSQEEIYKNIITEDLLRKVLEGIDLVVFSFGSSGTGKTYTTTGFSDKYEYRGLAPRVLEDLFRIKEENIEIFNMDIYLTYVEIVGKGIYNLLRKGKPLMSKTGFIKYDVFFGKRVDSVCQGLKLMFDGDCRRLFEKDDTHCGTCIITYEVVCVSQFKMNTFNSTSRIHIIDTAGTDFGSNAVKSMKCHTNANMAKCRLNTICSWVKKSFRPRASFIAYYLGTSFTNGYLRLVGHIKTDEDVLSYSISTLLFGTRLRNLPSPLLVRAKKKNADMVIKNLQEQLTELKENVIEKKLTSGVFMPQSVSQEQLEYIIRNLQYYFKSTVHEMKLLSIAHPSILLFAAKEVYNKDMQKLKEDMEKEMIQKESALQAEMEKFQHSKLMYSGGRVSANRSRSGSLRSRTQAKLKSQAKVRSLQQIRSPSSDPQFAVSKSEIYDVPKIDIEKEMMGEESYCKTFDEFLTRYPIFKMKIKSYEAEIRDGFREKCELRNKLTKIKQEINSLRIELEKEEWNAFNKSLDKRACDPKGRLINKSEQQDFIERQIDVKVETFNNLRNSLLTAHNRYIDGGIFLNETKAEAERQYNEYVKYIYSNILLLPVEEKTKNEPLGQTIINAEKKEEKEKKDKSDHCFIKELPEKKDTPRTCFTQLRKKINKK